MLTLLSVILAACIVLTVTANALLSVSCLLCGLLHIEQFGPVRSVQRKAICISIVGIAILFFVHYLNAGG